MFLIITYSSRFRGGERVHTVDPDRGSIGKSIKRRNQFIMPPRAQRNFKLRKDLSVRVIKAWLELLRLEGGILTWAYWDTDETVISEIFERHNLSECMGIQPPYHKTKYNCETFLKSTELYLTQSDIDRTLDEWIRALGNEE